MLGVLVNTGAIVAGALVGMLLQKGLPEKLSQAMSTAVALAVLYIGIDGVMSGENALVLVLSMVIGGLIGTLLDLDRRLENLGQKVEEKFSRGKGKSSLAEGFVSGTLLFCVGAMAIVGALNSGLSGDHQMQFTKAILDFIAAVVMASALGIGVILSSVSVFVVQGSITLLARVIAPLLSDYVISEMTCAGSVLIIALALNLLGITKIRLMNFVPAILLPIVLCMFM